MAHVSRSAGLFAGVLVLGAAHIAFADSASCQKAISKELLKFEKTSLKANVKCLKEENAGSLPGPCPDTGAQLKIQ